MAGDEELVIPPPDVRLVINKALALVQRTEEDTEAAVEARLLAAEPHLFGFLNETDTYHDYYVWRKSHDEETAVTTEASLTTPRSVPPLEFCYEQPPMAEKTLALIKLAALYTSHNPDIPDQLPQPRFAFVKPEHQNYALFTEFVKQYKLARTTKPKPVSTLLERAVERARAMAHDQDQQNRSKKAQDAEKQDFAAIDWQDFEVVETVEFLKAEKLPPPFNKEDIMVHGLDVPDKKPPPKKKEPTLTSPYTGEQIPASQYDEHVRILGLDPRWKEQHDKVEAERNTTNLAIDDVALNLKRRADAAAEASKKAKR